jgi:hypothetical protein
MSQNARSRPSKIPAVTQWSENKEAEDGQQLSIRTKKNAAGDSDGDHSGHTAKRQPRPSLSIAMIGRDRELHNCTRSLSGLKSCRLARLRFCHARV